LRNAGANLADEFSYYKTTRRFTQLKLQSVLYEIWASKKLSIHPSPNLAPSDFYLFKDLQKVLRGRRFSGEDEMKSAIDEHFAHTVSEYFFRGIKQLYGRCERCIAIDGDYIEK
jgi:hypothetical protein